MSEMITFTAGQCLHLPELAQNLGLDTVEFHVMAKARQNFLALRHFW
jgi:hypothetical protein